MRPEGTGGGGGEREGWVGVKCLQIHIAHELGARREAGPGLLNNLIGKWVVDELEETLGVSLEGS